MTSLYIITSELYEKANQYKVGIHTGEVTALINRYRTPIPTIKVLFFVTLADGKAKQIEDKVKAAFSKVRIVGSGNNDSEFYQVSFNALHDFISGFLIGAAPRTSGEVDTKIQEQFNLVETTMRPIGFLLNQMEKCVSLNLCFSNSRISDLIREIRLEKDAFAIDHFKGEHLTTIKDLVIEIYDSCNVCLPNKYFGEQIIASIRQIILCMDNINRLTPDKFKKVSRVAQLSLGGTSKDDMIYRRYIFFVDRLSDQYIRRYWDELLDIDPSDWHQIINRQNNELNPKKYIKHKKKSITNNEEKVNSYQYQPKTSISHVNVACKAVIKSGKNDGNICGRINCKIKGHRQLK